MLEAKRVVPAVLFLLGTRLGLVAAAYIAVSIVPAAGNYIRANHVHNQPFASPLWLEMWSRWDAEWYTQIAEQGYRFTELEPQYPPQAPLAYYPLYPLLIRAVAWPTGNTILAGLLVSSIAAVVFVIYLSGLIERELPGGDSGEAVRLLLLYPGAFFLTAVYPESLFLAVVVASFWYARRGNWLAAGLVAALAPLIKTQGLILAGPLAVEYLLQQRRQRRWLDGQAVFVAGPLVGILPYALYCHSQWGDWLAFIHSQSAGWRGGIRFPLAVYREFLTSGQTTAHQYAFSWYDFCLSLLFLAGLVPVFRRLPLCYGIYAAGAVVIPLCGGLMSFNRYSLLSFPHFMVLPLLLGGGLQRHLVAACLASLLGATACIFALWGWVG